jgi:hypothetical protein
VYVLLSALDQTDPSTVVAGASKKVPGEDDDVDDAKPSAEEKSTAGSETIGSEPDEDSDDIHDIAESRTFLAKVSSRATSIHWLDLAEYDMAADQSFPVGGSPHEAQQQYAAAPGMPPGDPQSQYFHAMGYAAQQHQNALKSHQQYFFQMQQRQQGGYQPHAHMPPPPQWQYMGQADPNHMGAPAGEAAAQHKRGHEDGGYQMPPPQWGMYYPPPGHYHPDHGHGPPPPGAMPPEMQPPPHHGSPHQHQHPSPHDYREEDNGNTDESDTKRQRVV